MRSLLFLIYKLWVGFVFWTSLLLLYPFFKLFLSREKWYPIVFKLKKFWSNWIRIFIFCPIKITYETKLPEPPYIICSNHSSYLDTVFMYSAFPDYFLFVGKGELLKWPLFRIFFKNMDIPVRKENIRMAQGVLQKAYEAIERKECIAIYPEATIPVSAPKMGRFKNGAFKMAKEMEVPIVPITWQSNFKILNDLDNVWSTAGPATVKAHVGEPIDKETIRELSILELNKMTRSKIEKYLDL